MLEWISQNKEWIFSGAGIAVLAAMWWLVKKLSRSASSAAPTSISNSVNQAPVINVAPVFNVPPHAAQPQEPKLHDTTGQELKYKQAHGLIAAIAEVRIVAQEAKTAAEVLDARANSLAGGRGEYARVSRVAPTEHNHCINTLIKLRSAVSAAKQHVVQARNAGLLGGEREQEGKMSLPSPYSNLCVYLHTIERASSCEEPTSWIAGERRGKREVRWEQIVESLKGAEQQNPQAMLDTMTVQQDTFLQRHITKIWPGSD